MSIFLFVLMLLFAATCCEDDLRLFSKLRTGYLEKYSGYSSVVILHFNVPQDVSFVSFKFQADQTSYSIFSCSVDDVILYMKYGAPPVINPDNSKIPVKFYNASRTDISLLEFSSNKKYYYINMTSPSPGSYFAAAFHPHVNPNEEGITQDGLTAKCSTYIDAMVYVRRTYVVDLGRGVDMNIELANIEEQIFKFYVPESIDHILLTISKVVLCASCTQLVAKLQANNIPHVNNSIAIIEIDKQESEPTYYQIWAREDTWYYVAFNFISSSPSEEFGSFTFEIKTFSSVINTYETSIRNNLTQLTNGSFDMFKMAVFKKLRNDFLITYIPYKQYDLTRDGKSDSFLYSFEMQPLSDGSLPIAINLTNGDFSVLKFFLNDAIDVGGTLQFIVAFKPRVTISGRSLLREPEPENHTIIACIRNNVREIPTWPHGCMNNQESNVAPIILNKTHTNSTVLIPYPEAGNWFASFKLYCGECEPCDCPENCIIIYRSCFETCERNCSKDEYCDKCMDDCAEMVMNKNECANCDCDGPCKRTDITCNTSVLFDISSYPCITGSCGRNGRCVFMVAEGFVYSTCVCTNNYKGWDCTDNSEANSYAMIVLELLLLVLSNLLFMPAVYIAYKREYYVEAVVYFSTFFFSTFYHACDAGENIISFCIVRLSVLQFSDFFCGLLSIWVTVIAMAYLPYPWPSLCHMIGSIMLAFGTTYNKQSIWVFLIPVVVGLVIMLSHWSWKYKKTKSLFPRKLYIMKILPVGLVVVVVGLLTYALFQTQSNYKYLHSLWHMLMAIGVIILLPDKKRFLPISYM